MTLKNELYVLLDRVDSADGCFFSLRLQPECFIYRAHFPGQPITPGVCIIQTAKELLEEWRGRHLEIVRVKNVKFQSPITPKDGAVLTYAFSRLREEEGDISASVVVTEGDTVMSKISFTCRDQAANPQV